MANGCPLDANIPQGFTLDQAPTPQAPVEASSVPQGFQLDEDKYGGTGQTIQAGLEGALRGAITSPGAAMAEKAFGLASPEGIRGRAEQHPIASGIGEISTLVGGALTGTGEGALLSKVGEGAVEAAGIKGASYGAKVGSSIVKNAAEMAAYQSQDEAGKMVLGDPNAGAQSAIANVGLAAALGGVGGGIFTGAISPLWKATGEPATDYLLNLTKNHLNGGSQLIMPEAREAAAKVLGIELEPVMRAGLAEDVRPNAYFGDLRRGEHPEILSGIDKLHNEIANSVMEPMGLTPEMVLEHSENQSGKNVQQAFQDEVKEKYDPRAVEMQQRDAEAAPIRLTDDARLDRAGKIIEKGITDFGTDTEEFRLYQNYADRLLARNTVGEVDKLRSQIYNDMKKASRAADDNTWKALNDIRTSLGDFQTQQIEKAARETDKAALAKSSVAGMPRVKVGEIPSAKPGAEDLIARREAANKNYAQYANTMDTVMDHLGLGEFKGTKGAISKVTEKLSPEQVFRKFTIDGNADLIPFLKEHFPNTYEKIIENERKDLIKPAILAADKKGKNPIDVNKLNDIIKKKMAGNPEYVKAVLPDQVIQRAEAGKTLSQAIPAPRDSGTPAGIAKIFRSMSSSALAGVAWATGHGVVGGAMAGEMAQRLGKDAPEAIKLAYLKFLGSDKPVNAAGFKMAVDYLHAAKKGAQMLEKSADAVFKPTAEVVMSKNMPSKSDTDKLDKIVSKANDPKTANQLMSNQESQLGHYLPEHQTAMSTATLGAVQYLKGLKPQPYQPNPLDKAIPPSKEQEARYNRALQIAQQPAVVLQHIKDGTIQVSDLADLKGMYPAMYQQMAQKLSNNMINAQSEEHPIPYKTRVGLSLFLGQPLDSSMSPTSIMAAQPVPKQPQGAPQPKGSKSKSGSPSKLGKMPSMYQTPIQGAEHDRSKRD